MTQADTLTSAEMALRAWCILEGEDDYTMGDPGPLGAVGKARAALDTLFACSQAMYGEGAPDAWSPESPRSKISAEIESLDTQLTVQLTPAREQQILDEVGKLPFAAKPLIKMSSDEIATTSRSLEEIFRVIGSRTNRIRSHARDEVLVGYLQQIVDLEPGMRDDLRRDLVALIRGLEKIARGRAADLGLN